MPRSDILEDSYNNAVSGLTATTTKDAIDELAINNSYISISAPTPSNTSTGGTGNKQLAIGHDVQIEANSTVDSNNIGIGFGINIFGSNVDNVVAIGHDINGATDGSVIIGGRTSNLGTTGQGCVSIGYNATAIGLGAVGIGDDVNVSSLGTRGIAIGAGAGISSTGDYGIAMGWRADVTALGGIAIGGNLSEESLTSGNYGITIGVNSTTSGAQAVGIGYTTLVNATNGIAIGNGATIDNSFQGVGDCIAIGTGASIAPDNTATGNAIQSIAIGFGSTVEQGFNSVCIGTNPTTSANGTVAIGTNAIASNIRSIAIGPNSSALNDDCISFGENSVANALRAIQLGVGTNDASDTLQFQSNRLANAQGLYTSFTSPTSYSPADIDNVTSHLEAIDAALRIKLTANTDFYVATTGNDSNNGLTVGTPWLTIAHALEFVSENYDLNGFQATINCAAGTYTLTSTLQVPEFVNTGYQFCDVILRGNSNTDTFVDFNTGTAGITVRNQNSTRFCIRAFNFTATSVTNGIVCDSQSYLDLQSCIFSTGTYTTVIRVENHSNLEIGFTNFENITATFAILLGETFSIINQVQNLGIPTGDTCTATDFLVLFGSSTYFVEDSKVINNLGTFTGRKYTISSQATVQFVNEASPSTFFPGTTGQVVPAGYGDVNYDNSTSGLTATNIQAAIDELAANSGGGPKPDAPGTTILIDPTSGDDANDGFASAVQSMDRVMELLRTYNWNYGVVNVSPSNSVVFSTNTTLDFADVDSIQLLTLFSGFTSNSITATLTIANFRNISQLSLRLCNVSGAGRLIVRNGTDFNHTLSSFSSTTSATLYTLDNVDKAGVFGGSVTSPSSLARGVQASNVGVISSASLTTSGVTVSDAFYDLQENVGHVIYPSSSQSITGKVLSTIGRTGLQSITNPSNFTGTTLNTADITEKNYTFSTEVSGAGTSNALVNQILLVNATGARTVNPPSSPLPGDRFKVVNSRANANTNNITISFATQLRHGANTNRVINTARGKAEFMYVNATIGWIDID